MMTISGWEFLIFLIEARESSLSRSPLSPPPGMGIVFAICRYFAPSSINRLASVAMFSVGESLKIASGNLAIQLATWLSSMVMLEWIFGQLKFSSTAVSVGMHLIRSSQSDVLTAATEYM